MSIAERPGYSADVDISLHANGMALEVSQVGEEIVILRQPCELPPMNARIEIIIDGERKCYPVLLHRGATINSRIVPFVDCIAVCGYSLQDQLAEIQRVVDDGRVIVNDDVPF